MSDIWASWLLILVLYTLNAFAVFKLCMHYANNFGAAIFAGLCFSSSAFMLGNIELLNSLGFFPIPVSLLYLEKYNESGRPLALTISIMILGISHFASGYAFLFGIILWFSLLIYRRPHIRLSTIRIGALTFTLAVLPFILQLIRIQSADVYNPTVNIPDSMERFSLGVNSLLSSLPNNIIYPAPKDTFEAVAVKIRYYANSGILFTCLLIASIVMQQARNWYYIFVFVVFGAVSFGPTLHICGEAFKLPFYYLREIPLAETFFRIPGRAFVVAQFGMSMLVGFSLSILMKKARPILGVGFFIFSSSIFVIENVPMPMNTPEQKTQMNLPKVYTSLPDSVCNLAILPSSIFTGSGYVNGISEFSREYHYQYWQTKHHHNIINGSSSYFPCSRMENNNLLINITSDGNLERLITSNKLHYIVMHTSFTMTPNEEQILLFLSQNEKLALVSSNDESYVFRVK